MAAQQRVIFGEVKPARLRTQVNVGSMAQNARNSYRADSTTLIPSETRSLGWRIT